MSMFILLQFICGQALSFQMARSRPLLRSQILSTHLSSVPVTSPAAGDDWSEIASAALFGNRYYHSCLVFNDMMWVLGGTANGNDNINDVWSSMDGAVWNSVVLSATWSPRRDHSSVVFKDKMWILGGLGSLYLNDVWSSWDGSSWSLATPSARWAARCGHTSVVFQEKMWVIGGYDSTGTSDVNDIWSSLDGTTWTLEAPAPWGLRYYHTSVVHNSKIWVIGGATDGSQDVWNSNNGSTWTFISNSAASARMGHSSVVYNGMMWIVGGSRTSEVWNSGDGYSWTMVTPSAQWKGRDFHSSVVYFNLIWILGGYTTSNRGSPEVWASVPPKEDDVLFALHTGDTSSIALFLTLLVLGGVYGYTLDFVRRKQPSVVPLSTTYLQNPLIFAFAACGWISALLAMLDLLAGGKNNLIYGVLVLLGLVLPTLISLGISLSILLSLCSRIDLLKLTPYLDGHVMVEYKLCVLSLTCVSMMDPTLLAFLPWKMSDFASNSDGFPNMRLFKLLMYQEAFFAALICIAIALAPMRFTFVSTTAFILNIIGFLATVVNIVFKLKIKNISQYNSVAVTEHLFASEAVVSLMHFRANDKYQELDDDGFGGVGTNGSSSPRERSSSIDNEATKQRLKELAILKAEIEEYRRKEEEEKRLAALRNPYADEDVEVLEQQLKAHNIQAARYIPLPVLKSELSLIMSKMQNNEPFDERRLDYLFRCLAFNKDYIAEQEEEHRLWQESVSALTNEYLQQERAFIPADIFSASLDNLVSRGVSTALAKRLLSKKCLWLVRMPKDTIAKLHEADLMGRYNPQGQNLDIVELLAIYAACPKKFDLDTTGKKEAWRVALEDSVKAIMKQKDANNLIGSKLRNPVYKGQIGQFPGDEMYIPAIVPKETFGEKDPFLAHPPHKLHKSKDDLLSLEIASAKHAEASALNTSMDQFMTDHLPPHQLSTESSGRRASHHGEQASSELNVPFIATDNISLLSDPYLASHHPPHKLPTAKHEAMSDQNHEKTNSTQENQSSEILVPKPRSPFMLAPPPRPLRSHKKTVEYFKVAADDEKVNFGSSGEEPLIVSIENTSHAAPSQQMPQNVENGF